MSSNFVHQCIEQWLITDYREMLQTWDPGPAKELVTEVLQGKHCRSRLSYAKPPPLHTYHDGMVLTEMRLDEVVWQTGRAETKNRKTRDNV